MGEMLFVRAAYAREAWAGSSITMSQTVSSVLAPSTLTYAITAIEDETTQTKLSDGSYATTEAALPLKPTFETGAKTSPAPLETDTTSRTELETQQEDIVGSRLKAQISPTPLASQAPSMLLHLPLEVRLQIYHWTLLLGTIDRPSGSGTPVSSSSSFTSSTATAAKTANDAASAVSVSSTLFHCMPPYFFDNPQHFGPGDGIMFMSMFASNAHQRPLYFRRVLPAGEKKDGSKVDDVQLLAVHRPVGRALPIGLLASCRQVYREARTLAFETSEFVFMRLFCSGLSTAHAFVVLGSQTYPGTIGGDIPRLQSWQRDSLRHVRLELDVSVADMGWTGPGRDSKYAENNTKGEKEPKIIDGPKWLAFCDAVAKGLHGMRVLLNITEEQYQASPEEGDVEEDTKEEYTPDESAAAARSIVVQGFARLTALRQLEIELVWVLRGRFRSRAANMTPAATRNNLMWCAAVERAINEAREKRLETTSQIKSSRRQVSTRVVCVERIYDEERKKEGLL
jgi:hypothetical protein